MSPILANLLLFAGLTVGAFVMGCVGGTLAFIASERRR